jgi:hypothetical protein
MGHLSLPPCHVKRNSAAREAEKQIGPQVTCSANFGFAAKKNRNPMKAAMMWNSTHGWGLLAVSPSRLLKSGAASQVSGRRRF